MSVMVRFLIVSGLTLFDSAATLVAVGLLGATELNPLVGAAIGRYGLVATMSLRAILGVAGAAVLAAVAEDPRNRLGGRPLTWTAVVLGLLAGWHVAQFTGYWM